MKTGDIQIVLPSSKSLSIRWLLVNHLSGGRVPLSGISTADDVKVLRKLLMQLNQWDRREVPELTLDCGESGTVARFMLSVMATAPNGTVVIDGAESLLRRPMAPLVKSLRNLGGSTIEYFGDEGCLPLRVKGGFPLMKLAEIDPSQSGQFVSALALAAAATPRGLHVRMTSPPPSRSYIGMTCSVLSQAGAQNDYAPNHTTIRVQPFEKQSFHRPVQIERDWSAAAFFYMAAVFLPHRRIRLTSLSLGSMQGDRVAADLFKSFGVKTVESRSPYRNTRSLVIEGGGEIGKGFVYDFSDCPDLVIPVAVTCAAMGVEAWLSGLHTLRFKECDRLTALADELGKMGAQVDVGNDKMHIAPSVLMPKQPVRTYGDHRIAMAFGVLTLLFPNMQIDDKQVVSKSFPGFWQELAKIDNGD